MLSAPPDVYTDLQGLSRLRSLTRRDSAKALNMVSQQFEALFLQMMLKSVRESSVGDSLFASDQLDFYREMHDNQLAVELARKGGVGIAEMLVEQLEKSLPLGAKEVGSKDKSEYPVPEARLPSRVAITDARSGPVERARPLRDPARFESPAEFVSHLWPHAERAAAELGVTPQLLLAQAALETGWGKKIIMHSPGNSSHNLFNIKADRRWKGERTGVDTLEYVDGQMVRQRAAFRVYDSFAESFADFVAFLQQNPRYTEALRSRGDDRAFITELHRAGYATDPKYVTKILRILESPTLTAAIDTIKFSRNRSTTPYEVALAEMNHE